jgi:hypothetical protein
VQTSSMMRTVRQEQGLRPDRCTRMQGEQREKSADAITCSRSGLFSSSSRLAQGSPITHSFRLAVAHALSALSPPLSEPRESALSTSWRTKRRSSVSARPGPPLPVRPVHEHGCRRTDNVDDEGIQTVRDGDGSVYVSPQTCARSSRSTCSPCVPAALAAAMRTPLTATSFSSHLTSMLASNHAPALRALASFLA